MKSIRHGLLTAFLALGAGAGAAHAQGTTITLGMGAGGAIPIGDFADATKVGLNAQGNVGIRNPTWPVNLRFDLMYSALSGQDVDVGVDEANGPDAKVVAGLANVELPLTRTTWGGGLFVVGGAGVYNRDYDDNTLNGFADRDSETKFGVFGGAGYKWANRSLIVSLEGKFHNIFTDGSNSQMIPVSLVVEIPMGAR
jgi:hypothetical protein